jgi:transposase
MTIGIAEFNNGGAAPAAQPTEKPLSKMNKGELQELAGTLELDTEGTVAELRERIKEKQEAAE